MYYRFYFCSFLSIPGSNLFAAVKKYENYNLLYSSRVNEHNPQFYISWLLNSCNISFSSHEQNGKGGKQETSAGAYT